MNIREISDVFKDTASGITALKSYNFGWASDRVRQGNTEDYQELNEFPRVFFSVPTITASDQTRKQDTYQVTLFFDDLLGYDNEGDADLTLQIDKWANLQQYANYFVQRLNKIKQSILPNYLFIPEAPSITFDSFTGIQRMITVQLSFNLVVPTNCDPGIITLVQCIANIVTSSNLTASLTTLLKFAASLEGRATLTADINFVQKVASSLNANASLVSDINFVQKVQASLLATGTTTADLTVQSAASLLLDIYPSAAAAYSLRKLRTAYTGSAIRVRRSSDNTEQDIGFTGNDLNTSALTTFCGAGNGFVTTWYDQSGNGRDAIQTVQANQPQIVSSGSVITLNGKPVLNFDGSNDFLRSTFGSTLTTNLTYIASFKLLSLPSAFKNLYANASDLVTTYLTSANIWSLYNGAVLSSGVRAQTIPYLNFTIFKLSTAELFMNNTSLVSGSMPSPSTNNLDIANSTGVTGRQINVSYWELVLYNADQTSNRSGIQSNINTYYAIY